MSCWPFYQLMTACALVHMPWSRVFNSGVLLSRVTRHRPCHAKHIAPHYKSHSTPPFSLFLSPDLLSFYLPFSLVFFYSAARILGALPSPALSVSHINFKRAGYPPHCFPSEIRKQRKGHSSRHPTLAFLIYNSFPLPSS